MTGRILIVILLVSAVIGGVGMWYLQVHAFYRDLPAQDSVMLTPAGGGSPRAVPVRDFRGIDADSSPIRYRACFTLDAAAADFAPYADAAPRNAPGWFDCFDAAAIGAALEDGRAQAITAQANIEYGIDRVVAVYPDGRAYAWHQINPCGAAFFDGDPVPPGCPAPPESTD